MPIYEFECRKCENRFEKLCGINAAQDSIECPECKGTDNKKLMSGFFSRASGGGSSSSCNCGGSCGKSSCAGCHH